MDISKTQNQLKMIRYRMKKKLNQDGLKVLESIKTFAASENPSLYNKIILEEMPSKSLKGLIISN